MLHHIEYQICQISTDYWSLFHQTDDMVRISLCFGLTVASMAQAIGHISGCHINPGVTSGLIVGGKIGVIKGLLYIAVQSFGGIVGAAILKVNNALVKSKGSHVFWGPEVKYHWAKKVP